MNANQNYEKKESLKIAKNVNFSETFKYIKYMLSFFVLV